MGEFFKGWRRKAGVATLGLSVVISIAWFGSYLTNDWLRVPAWQPAISSLNSSGGVVVSREVPSRISVARNSRVIMVSTLGVHRIWRIGQDPPYCEFLNLDSFALLSAAIDPEGSFFVSGERARKVRSTSTGQTKVELPYAPGFASTMEFSTSGKYLATGGMIEIDDPVGRRHRGPMLGREQIRVWDWQQQKMILDSPGTGTRTWGLAFANSERFLVTVNSTSVISVWGLQKNSNPIHHKLNFEVRGGIAISDDDQWIVLGSEKGLKAFKMDRLLSQK